MMAGRLKECLKMLRWSEDDLAEELGSTEFIGYSSHEGEGVVLAILKNGQRVEDGNQGETVTILMNQTPFYGESGG